ncbi:MAG: hypothetical protein ACXQTS_05850, partial [Candidatus Methanospirareceae archaeon]
MVYLPPYSPDLNLIENVFAKSWIVISLGCYAVKKY